MKGNTPVEPLFILISLIKGAMMKFCFQLFIIHVAGSRMTQQGTDGTSRGELPLHSIDRPLRASVPLNLTCFERSTALMGWLESWVGSKRMFLKLSNCFVEAHDLRFSSSNKIDNPRALTFESTTCIWSTLPSLGDAALEQLRYARIKRQTSTHVFVIPKLF